jgi:hypothetical protein
MGSSFASNVQVPLDAAETTLAPGLWPESDQAAEREAFLPTRSAGQLTREITAARPTLPPPAHAAESGSIGRPNGRMLALAASIAVLLLGLGWRPLKKLYRRSTLWFDAKALGVRRIIGVDDVDQGAVLTPAAVHERGWPLELMVQLLGPPDYAVVDPTGRIPPLILLARERVEKLEKSEKFRRYSEMRARKAQETAARVTKWIALQEEIISCPGTVEGSV